MTLEEIAARIAAHLKRFEGSEPRIAQGQFYKTYAETERGLIYLSYAPWRCGVKLTKADAIRYLAWLDAGNVGTHWWALRRDE